MTHLKSNGILKTTVLRPSLTCCKVFNIIQTLMGNKFNDVLDLCAFGSAISVLWKWQFLAWRTELDLVRCKFL